MAFSFGKKLIKDLERNGRLKVFCVGVSEGFHKYPQAILTNFTMLKFTSIDPNIINY